MQLLSGPSFQPAMQLSPCCCCISVTAYSTTFLSLPSCPRLTPRAPGIKLDLLIDPHSTCRRLSTDTQSNDDDVKRTEWHPLPKV